MTPAERADAYLSIPPGYALEHLHWSSDGDAVVVDGSTLAVAEELRTFLDGLFSLPPVPPFVFALAVLAVAKRPTRGVPAEFDRLRGAYDRCRGLGVVRNLGLLVGQLCRSLPPAAVIPEWREVVAALDRSQRSGPRYVRGSSAAYPPLLLGVFMRLTAERLAEFDDAALGHWLTYGCAPTEAGEKLAEPVEALPARIARLVRHAKRRPRLVGAAALTPHLDAALTFPPRRRTPDALPQGGYADVTTRGDPERLLPGQFALDPDEFVRRFAGRELLYFKREEPHAAEAPERVIVLDQGVRTWGGVRLGLAAAALSLLRRDAKRFGPARLAATSVPDVVDPQGETVEALAGVLEASDLTVNPAERLGRALAGDVTGPRDVILLTHPRALREPAVLAAATTRKPADRLLTLTVDEAGRAEVGEWSESGLLPLRSFRVDLAAAEAARVEEAPAPGPPVKGWSPWAGDVEPVGFPFRPGLVAEPLLMGFDAGGEWLAVVGGGGLLHGLAPDGSPPEVLPRPAKDGAVLTRVDAVLGVNGGVVVCGRMAPTTRSAVTVYVTYPDSPRVTARAGGSAEAPADWFAAAHYDRTQRRVTVHLLSPASDLWEWFAFPELHSVAVVRPDPATGALPRTAVDLTTGERDAGGPVGPMTRARSAYELSQLRFGSPPHVLPVHTRWSKSADTIRWPHLYLNGNTLKVKNADPPWVSFEPTRDGKPMFGGAAVHQAQLAGTTLAVSSSKPGARTLTLFRGPDGAVAADWPEGPKASPFALSADGERVARCRARREVVVSPASAAGRPLAVAGPARLHADLRCDLGAWPFWLTVWAGQFEHRFEVVEDRLVHDLRRGVPPAQVPDVERDSPAARSLDPGRFPTGRRRVAGGYTAVVDRAGQVVVFGRGGDAVAAVVVRREQAAVALPDGTVWGAAELIGGPATPGAGPKIAKAILAARG